MHTENMHSFFFPYERTWTHCINERKAVINLYIDRNMHCKCMITCTKKQGVQPIHTACSARHEVLCTSLHYLASSACHDVHCTIFTIWHRHSTTWQAPHAMTCTARYSLSGKLRRPYDVPCTSTIVRCIMRSSAIFIMKRAASQ